MSDNYINVVAVDNDNDDKVIMKKNFEKTEKFQKIRDEIADNLKIKELECSFWANRYSKELDTDINRSLIEIMTEFDIQNDITLTIGVTRGPIQVIVFYKEEIENIIMDKIFERKTKFKVVRAEIGERIDGKFDCEIKGFDKKTLGYTYVTEIDYDLEKTLGYIIGDLDYPESHNELSIQIIPIPIPRRYNIIRSENSEIPKKTTYPRYPLFIGFGLHSILFWISFGLYFFSSKKFKNRQIIHFFSLYITETILTLFITVIYFAWLKEWKYNITFVFLIVYMLFYLILTPLFLKSILKNGKVITQKNHNYFHALNGLIYAICAFILWMTSWNKHK